MADKFRALFLSIVLPLTFSAVHAEVTSSEEPLASGNNSVVASVEATTASVGLTWEKTEISQILAFEQTSAEMTFRFTNHSKSPVAIVEVTTTCGCLSATAPTQRVYAPGEKGEIKATFTLGKSSAGQEKLIHVTTSDNLNKLTVLKARFALTQPATLAVSELEWKLGEVAVEKTVKIAVIPKATLRLVALTPEQQKLVAVELTPARDPGDPKAKDKPVEAYLLKIRPLDPNRPLHLPLDIQVFVGEQPTSSLMVMLHVQ